MVTVLMDGDGSIAGSTGDQQVPCGVPFGWTGRQGMPACGHTGKELESEPQEIKLVWPNSPI